MLNCMLFMFLKHMLNFMSIRVIYYLIYKLFFMYNFRQQKFKI